jgi:hypothetical protein
MPTLKQARKGKSFSLNSLMKNPKLSKMVEEAWDAPLGSTKRERINSVIKALKKLNSNRFDGMGGFNVAMGSQYMSQVAKQPKQSKEKKGGMIIFPSAPKRRQDGMGGSMFDWSPISGDNPFGDTSWLTPSSNKPATTSTTINITPTQNPAQTSIAELNQKYLPSYNYPSSFSTQAILPQTSKTQPTSGYQAPTTTQQASQGPSTWTQDKANAQYQQYLNAGYTPEEASSRIKQLTGFTPASVTGISDSSGDPFSGASDYTDYSSFLDQQYQSLSATDQKRFKKLFDAVKAGVGPETFAYNAMSDIGTLKELFPGVPEDELPVGASLSRQILSLRDVLKKDYNLDNLLNQKSQLLKTGITLQDDMTDYIRYKDDYLKSVDEMIGKTTDAALKMDMANPKVNQIMTKYTDYLYTLKTRQNKRYIEFLNTAINQYNGQLQYATDMYQTNMNAFLEDFKLQSTVKEEDYNRVYSTLAGLYNQISGAYDLETDRSIKQQQLINTKAQTLIDIFKAAGTSDEKSWLKEYGQYETLLTDEDGKLSVDNILEAMKTGIGQGLDIGGIQFVIEKSIKSDLRSGIDDKTSISQYYNKWNEYAALANALKQNEEIAGTGEYGDLLMNIVNSNAELGLKQYLDSNKESVISVVNKLVGKYDPGIFARERDYEQSDKDTFMTEAKKVAPSLDTKVLNDLFYAGTNPTGKKLLTDMGFGSKAVNNNDQAMTLLANLMASMH